MNTLFRVMYLLVAYNILCSYIYQSTTYVWIVTRFRFSYWDLFFKKLKGSSCFSSSTSISSETASMSLIPHYHILKSTSQAPKGLIRI
ncbi:hypothetical protein AQUCO_04700039v1 [Aquilegia coerulea]|uniref:Uncharacterized protein n=1 Tax=Aquilegia coerulea TaxID=218851 RepID=A0A2G5CKV2_AQUCA|nr:hypothetical protein AQUCO_04700039v1 [Aquilegia coerulea]